MSTTDASLSPPPPAAPPPGSFAHERLLSLDAFRGFDIAAMLLVNMTWNTSVFHPQLFHIDWNDPRQGATFTDLVFPWFLFIMGAAIPLSMRSGRGRSMPRWKKIAAAAKRGLVLYLFGVLLTFAGSWDTTPMSWPQLFSWNILQLLGVGYFVAVTVCLIPSGRLPRWVIPAAFVTLVVVGKWVWMCLPDPDTLRAAMDAVGHAPRGAALADGVVPTGPGTFTHFDDGKRYFALEHTKVADAEAGGPRLSTHLIGWLGMSEQFLPCAAIAVLGALATQILTADRWSKVRRGVILLGCGLVLWGASLILAWGYDPRGGGLFGTWTIPNSKWFFSPSYCLLSAGTGTVLLAAFYLWIDCWKITSGFVWRVMGLNALALYMAAELSFKMIWSVWLIRAPVVGERGLGARAEDGSLRLASDSIMGGTMKWFDHALGGWRSFDALGRTWTWSPGLTAHVALYLVLWWLFCVWLDRKKWYWKV